jgi:hypothetical protein
MILCNAFYSVHYIVITCNALIAQFYMHVVVFRPLLSIYNAVSCSEHAQYTILHMRILDLAHPNVWWLDLCPTLTQRLPSTQN